MAEVEKEPIAEQIVRRLAGSSGPLFTGMGAKIIFGGRVKRSPNQSAYVINLRSSGRAGAKGRDPDNAGFIAPVPALGITQCRERSPSCSRGFLDQVGKLCSSTGGRSA